jgi:hypothetical protein
MILLQWEPRQSGEMGQTALPDRQFGWGTVEVFYNIPNKRKTNNSIYLLLITFQCTKKYGPVIALN